MSLIVDSEVRARREHTPWTIINMHHFIREACSNTPLGADPRDHKTILTVQERGDVSSGVWYTLEWTGEDGERKSVSSQEYDLLKWRAADVEMRARYALQMREKEKITGGV